MGPSIILDKSSLQALSYEEILTLGRHYFVNITPILAIEILADLKKPQKGERLPKNEVIQLSKKLLQPDSAVSVHYKSLMETSLLDKDFAPGRRPVISGPATRVTDDTGEHGIVIKESPEQKAIRKWQAGKLGEAEEILAQRWRQTSREVDLEEFKRKNRQLSQALPGSKDPSSLVHFVDRLLSGKPIQTNLLTWLLTEFSFAPELAQKVLWRWEGRREQSLRNFAPYAYHCFRSNLVFCFGLLNGTFGTKSTNRIDLEYLYYVPFCEVFSTRDTFQQSIIRPFLEEGQFFVPGDELKSDLRTISNWWRNLTDGEKTQWQSRYGDAPPQDPASFTFQVWEKLMPNAWRDTGRADLPEEDLDEVLRRIQSVADGDVTPGPRNLDIDEADFVTRELRIGPDDPCPCKSGKSARECCLKDEWPDGSAG